MAANSFERIPFILDRRRKTDNFHVLLSYQTFRQKPSANDRSKRSQNINAISSALSVISSALSSFYWDL